MPQHKLDSPYVITEKGVDPAAVQRNLEGLVQALNELASRFFWGTGSPENVVTAPVGCVYFRLDGGVGTTVYAKSSGTGNTGWSALS